MSVYDKLSELNITLPPVSVPAAAYVPYVQTGNLVFLSGHIARKDGKPWAGAVRQEHHHRRRQAGRARRGHRPAGHAARRLQAVT